MKKTAKTKTAEVMVDTIKGKVVSKVFASHGSHGDQECVWLVIQFEDKTDIRVPMLCKTWGTQNVWPKT